ncbi:hypothetical protein B0H14DRAFT_3883632 [Mycena olivaceomarginata]|nr:hypothetical protein B0H14DRAFT_3883632 [Mycena olivaceomarginata]
MALGCSSVFSVQSNGMPQVLPALGYSDAHASFIIFTVLRRILFRSSFVTPPAGSAPFALLVAPGGKGLACTSPNGFFLAGFISRAPPRGFFFSGFARTLSPTALALHMDPDAVVGDSLPALIDLSGSTPPHRGGWTRAACGPIIFGGKLADPLLCILRLRLPDPTSLGQPLIRSSTPHVVSESASTQTVFVCVSLFFPHISVEYAIVRRIEWVARIPQVLPALVYPCETPAALALCKTTRAFASKCACRCTLSPAVRDRVLHAPAARLCHLCAKEARVSRVLRCLPSCPWSALAWASGVLEAGDGGRGEGRVERMEHTAYTEACVALLTRSSMDSLSVPESRRDISTSGLILYFPGCF